MKPWCIGRYVVMLFVLATVLVMSPASAQSPGAPERAPRPPQGAAPASEPESEMPSLWSIGTPAVQDLGVWNDTTNTPFAYTRFDAGFFPKNYLVYFMGGRLANGTTDGSVWAYTWTSGYTDTGVDLPTPIANYTMNLLEDANGMGFYTFCGRDNAGNNINVVQVYYPDSNTAVQLGPEDNYPGSGSCMGGLNVVYKNKVYIAGGYNASLAPHNWGEIWVFDPLAPAGSRWTRLASANLAIPRAYIMGALVDDKIYAIGGSYYCDTLLCNTNIVEVLDLSAPTPVWSDAAAADLPEVCSEGRAFSFDSVSQYRDADGSSLAGKIISTCGGWPAENERVYLYDTKRNTWKSFASLNRDRRDQAAEFIPLAPLHGGLLLIWGGRSGSDSNVLTTPEYYQVLAGSRDVLLVDDDWDFMTSDYGGRFYYATALNALGYPWTVWDTTTQGTPQAADLAEHGMVVWFTGYDWQTPISPTEEIELIGYLEGGGRLLVSSQEQHYAYPDSTLMSGYFGVTNVNGDVMQRTVAGSPGDPLFASLGSYTLHRPDDWQVYWPAGGYEGPYNDIVHALPGATTPMIYTSIDEPNATRKSTPVYKTVYLAWPLEWVNTVQERAQILGRALAWLGQETRLYIPLTLK